MKKLTLPDKKRIRKWPRNAWRFLGDQWWPILSWSLVIILVSTLLGVQLMGLTRHAISLIEQNYAYHLQLNDLGLKAILANPVNLPHQLGIYMLEKFGIRDVLYLRALSALFGAAAIGAFYSIVKTWHTRRVAILSTVLFATSAWTLHVSRLAHPDVLLMMPMMLILCATWLEIGKRRKLVLTLCLITALLLIYVPGMIFFVVAGVAWQSKRIYKELRQSSLWFFIPWAILAICLLVPFIWMLAAAPKNLLAVLGLPNVFPSPKEYLVNLANVPVQLFVRGPADPGRWLGRLPVLDVFSGLMAVVGVYAYAFRFRLDRTKLLAGIFVAGSLLIAIAGGVSLTFMIPFIYLIVAGGITLMLQQWNTVFPRNPFAKTLATTLMSVVVLFAAFYHINNYFIAWPNAPETRATFNIVK